MDEYKGNLPNTGSWDNSFLVSRPVHNYWLGFYIINILLWNREKY